MRAWVSQSVSDAEAFGATRHVLCFFAVAGVMVASGCSVIKPTDSFTLLTELPPGFSIKGEASYVPRRGETCSVPAKKGRNYPGLKFFEQTLSDSAQTAQFEVPLSSMEGGCSLVLASFGYEVDAKYGAARLNIGRDYTGISFQDGSTNPSSTTYPTIFEKECQWLFRTVGPKNNIAKILQCKTITAPQGGVNRDQLSGKTVKVKFLLSKEESPYMGDTWIKFPEGWKRCMGKSLADPYAFCNGNTTSFKPFKMPDGRDCTVYPNCIEQGE